MNKGHVSKKKKIPASVQSNGKVKIPSQPRKTLTVLCFQVAGIEEVKNDATIRANS